MLNREKELVALDEEIRKLRYTLKQKKYARQQFLLEYIKFRKAIRRKKKRRIR